MSEITLGFMLANYRWDTTKYASTDCYFILLIKSPSHSTPCLFRRGH